MHVEVVNRPKKKLFIDN